MITASDGSAIARALTALVCRMAGIAGKIAGAALSVDAVAVMLVATGQLRGNTSACFGADMRTVSTAGVRVNMETACRKVVAVFCM